MTTNYEALVIEKDGMVGVLAKNDGYVNSDFLTKEEYRFLAKPNNSTAIFQLFLLALLFYASFAFYRYGHPVFYIVMLLYTLHYTLHVSHECWHSMLFDSKKANAIVGRVLSAILGFPYEMAKKIHFDHHRHLNEELDPGFVYTDPRLSRNDIQKKLFGTLLFLNQLKNIKQLVRAFGGDKSDVSGGGGIKTKDLAFLCCVHLSIMLVLIYSVGFGAFVIFEYTVLALLPFIDAIRGLIDHRKAIGVDSTGYTRNFRISILDKLITKTYFDWHTIHHLYPQIPQSNLKDAERLIFRRVLKCDYYNSSAKNSCSAFLESMK